MFIPLIAEQREDVIDILSPEDSLTKLSMNDFNLDYLHVKAVGKALAGHSKLCRINLTGNFLGMYWYICLRPYVTSSFLVY